MRRDGFASLHASAGRGSGALLTHPLRYSSSSPPWDPLGLWLNRLSPVLAQYATGLHEHNYRIAAELCGDEADLWASFHAMGMQKAHQRLLHAAIQRMRAGFISDEDTLSLAEFMRTVGLQNVHLQKVRETEQVQRSLGEFEASQKTVSATKEKEALVPEATPRPDRTRESFLKKKSHE